MSDKTSVEQERKEAIENFAKLVSEIRVGMLSTVCTDGSIRSRPMLTAATKFDGDLWFFSETADPKVAEINSNDKVNVSYASPDRRQYVSVCGTAEIVRDETKAEVLWETAFARWFPKGRTQTDLSLIKVSVTGAEYWDSSQNTMVQFGGLVKGIVTGHRPDPLEHERIDWPSKAAT